MNRSFLLLVLLLPACGGSNARSFLRGAPPADLTDPEVVSTWAPLASAPGVYLWSVLIGAEAGWQTGAPCPSSTQDGDAIDFQGDCIAQDGTEWFGSARIVTSEDGETLSGATYDGFGYERDAGCELPARSIYDGHFESEVTEVGGAFTTDLVAEIRSYPDEGGCELTDLVVGWDYEGEQHADGTWSGSGRVGSDEGVVEAETEGERVDWDVCDAEPLAGTTTLRAGGHVAVLTYDGATDCDPDGTATWTLDGEEMGEISGIYCATGPVGTAWLGLLPALGLIGWRRRT